MSFISHGCVTSSDFFFTRVSQLFLQLVAALTVLLPLNQHFSLLVKTYLVNLKYEAYI